MTGGNVRLTWNWEYACLKGRTGRVWSGTKGQNICLDFTGQSKNKSMNIVRNTGNKLVKCRQCVENWIVKMVINKTMKSFKLDRRKSCNENLKIFLLIGKKKKKKKRRRRRRVSYIYIYWAEWNGGEGWGMIERDGVSNVWLEGVSEKSKSGEETEKLNGEIVLCSVSSSIKWATTHWLLILFLTTFSSYIFYCTAF